MNQLTTTVLLVASFFYPHPPVICPLEQWARGYNETYFYGKLKLSAVSFENLAEDVMGETFCDPETNVCRIFISKKYQDNSPIYLEVLLHEMCHAATVKEMLESGHGPKWTNCMKRLAMADAFKGLW